MYFFKDLILFYDIIKFLEVIKQNLNENIIIDIFGNITQTNYLCSFNDQYFKSKLARRTYVCNEYLLFIVSGKNVIDFIYLLPNNKRLLLIEWYNDFLKLNKKINLNYRYHKTIRTNDKLLKLLDFCLWSFLGRCNVIKMTNKELKSLFKVYNAGLDTYDFPFPGTNHYLCTRILKKCRIIDILKLIRIYKFRRALITYLSDVKFYDKINKFNFRTYKFINFVI